MKNNQIYSLRELINYYDVILPDTSAINGSLDKLRMKKNMRKKVVISKDQYLSYGFWKDTILDNEKNNILFIPEVIVEIDKIEKVEFPYVPKGNYRKSAFKKFSRNTGIAVIEKKDFLEEVKNRGIIFSLNEREKEAFDSFYNLFKFLETDMKRVLSGADYPLVIDGLVSSHSRGKTALISNDYGILCCWAYLLRNPILDLKGKLDFYTRDHFDGFFKKKLKG